MIHELTRYILEMAWVDCRAHMQKQSKEDFCYRYTDIHWFILL